MSDQEVPAVESTSPAVPDDIASRIIEEFKRGELPAWMVRKSYNSAVLKIGLGEGETVSITAPTQRLSEARDTTNQVVLEFVAKKTAGGKVEEATIEEARARASRAATDYLAGVITEFGPAIKFERPLVVGDEVLFAKGDPIPPLSEVKDAAAREAIVKDHLAPGIYFQVALGAQGLSIPPLELLMAAPGNS